MELWDAYDKDFNKIEGVSLVRGEPLPDGYFHLVCDVVVKHRDGSYLLMQRDQMKHYGGMWELTAGGSALQGENALDCATRELKEETGIVAASLQEIGKVFHYERKSIYVIYLCITNCKKSDIVLQVGETSAYKWVSREELLDMPTDILAAQRTRLFLDELSH